MTSRREWQWVQDSPLGPLSVRVGPSGIMSAYLGPGPHGSAHRDVADAYEAYFAGSLDAIDALSVDYKGCTAFARAVYETLRAVPAGAVTSYGRLAADAGHFGAARAVGAAMRACPVSIAVPCHRVIAGNGSIGGWSGSLTTKRWLLAHEGLPRYA